MDCASARKNGRNQTAWYATEGCLLLDHACAASAATGAVYAKGGSTDPSARDNVIGPDSVCRCAFARERVENTMATEDRTAADWYVVTHYAWPASPVGSGTRKNGGGLRGLLSLEEIM